MPRTRAELEQAAADADHWLDTLDPTTLEAENIDDLRAIATGVAEVAEAEKRLAAAVVAARAGGRSWPRIAMALGVSKQAAAQRYGDAPKTRKKVVKRVIRKRTIPKRTPLKAGRTKATRATASGRYVPKKAAKRPVKAR